MIKPGTLCMIIGGHYSGGTCTVTGAPEYSASVAASSLTWSPECLMYPIDPADGLPPPIGLRWWCPAAILRPLNDPDSAPADPAYTKRRNGAYSYVEAIRKAIADEARK